MAMLKLLLWGSGIFFIYTVALQLIGSYELNYFDGAVQVASQNYTALGLTPYKDFSVVYPPGTSLLVGKLLPYRSVLEVNAFFTILFVGLFAVALKLFNGLNREFAYVMWLTHGLLIRIFEGRGALPYLLLEIIFLLVLYQKKYLGLIVPMAVIFVWLRWDWLLFFIIGLAGISIVKKAYRRAAIFAFGGYLLGAATLVWYLLSTNVLRNAWEFMVYIPLMLTGTFRHLPIPLPTLPIHPNALIYVGAGLMLLITIKLGKKVTEYPVMYVWTGVFIPYALGRSDWVHFIGIWMPTAIFWTFVCKDFNVSLKKSLAGTALFFLPLAGWYVKGVKSLEPRPNKVQLVLDEQIQNCKGAVRDLLPRSIFVGRLTYQRYLYNVASLYLTYPKVRPATTFIMEEPGIQNSCKYGKMAAEDLDRADRPMLAYLEKGVDRAENEAMEKMQSCGYIENYLNNSDYVKLGECEAYEKQFEVRLYK